MLQHQECIDAQIFNFAKNQIEQKIQGAVNAISNGEDILGFGLIQQAKGVYHFWLDCTSPDGFEEYSEYLKKLLEPGLNEKQ